MGDPNASIPTPQPVIMRPMFGAQPSAAPHTSFAFVSQAAVENGIQGKYGLKKHTEVQISPSPWKAGLNAWHACRGFLLALTYGNHSAPC